MVTKDPRIILVTGATRGIGRAVAAGLAAGGHTVLLGARDLDRGAAEAVAIGTDVQPVRIDVTDHDSIVAAAAQTGAWHGRLDGLVNNAGINVGYLNKPSESTLADFRAVYGTDVFGTVDVTLTMLPLLRASQCPRVVNVSSFRGSLGSADKWVGTWSTAYGTAKTALNAITVHFARELGERGFAVTAVSPGHVATDLTRGPPCSVLADSPAEFRGKGKAAGTEEAAARLPGLQEVHQVVS
jgi:NAD(P)-dependent dehydrogenase (short-subunit alcohol dehydrogenase family)